MASFTTTILLACMLRATSAEVATSQKRELLDSPLSLIPTSHNTASSRPFLRASFVPLAPSTDQMQDSIEADFIMDKIVHNLTDKLLLGGLWSRIRDGFDHFFSKVDDMWDGYDPTWVPQQRILPPEMWPEDCPPRRTHDEKGRKIKKNPFWPEHPYLPSYNTFVFMNKTYTIPPRPRYDINKFKLWMLKSWLGQSMIMFGLIAIWERKYWCPESWANRWPAMFAHPWSVKDPRTALFKDAWKEKMARGWDTWYPHAANLKIPDPMQSGRPTDTPPNLQKMMEMPMWGGRKKDEDD